jgi:hypothetical protein
MGNGRRPAAFGPVLFHPDYTVGSGITPDLLTPRTCGPKALAGLGIAAFTAGGELHPALRTMPDYRPTTMKIGQGPDRGK